MPSLGDRGGTCALPWPWREAGKMPAAGHKPARSAEHTGAHVCSFFHVGLSMVAQTPALGIPGPVGAGGLGSGDLHACPCSYTYLAQGSSEVQGDPPAPQLCCQAPHEPLGISLIPGSHPGSIRPQLGAPCGPEPPGNSCAPFVRPPQMSLCRPPPTSGRSILLHRSQPSRLPACDPNAE